MKTSGSHFSAPPRYASAETQISFNTLNIGQKPAVTTDLSTSIRRNIIFNLANQVETSTHPTNNAFGITTISYRPKRAKRGQGDCPRHTRLRTSPGERPINRTRHRNQRRRYDIGAAPDTVEMAPANFRFDKGDRGGIGPAANRMF